MRKLMTAAVLVAVAGTSSLGFAGTTSTTSGAARTCAGHGGYTAPTGWKVGTWNDMGRDGIEACSDDGGTDGTVRAGAGRGSAYAAVDLEGANDDYVYVTSGPDAGAYCGHGRYDEPAGFDTTVDDPDARDAQRTDDCL